MTPRCMCRRTRSIRNHHFGCVGLKGNCEGLSQDGVFRSQRVVGLGMPWFEGDFADAQSLRIQDQSIRFGVNPFQPQGRGADQLFAAKVDREVEREVIDAHVSRPGK